MSTITVNNRRSAHRANIVAEAVVSAYIHEIARPAPRPGRTRAPGNHVEGLRPTARPATPRRALYGPLVRPRRWAEHELAA
jgi:hypothetical protein